MEIKAFFSIFLLEKEATVTNSLAYFLVGSIGPSFWQVGI